jgi:hypothetical protein
VNILIATWIEIALFANKNESFEAGRGSFSWLIFGIVRNKVRDFDISDQEKGKKKEEIDPFHWRAFLLIK